MSETDRTTNGIDLLVTGAFQTTEEQLCRLQSLPFVRNLWRMPDERGAMTVEAEKIDAVIGNGLFLYHDIDDFKRLKFIQLTSAGLDRVPIERARARDIMVCNASGVYSVPMAEFALCGVLNLYKNSRFFANNQTLARWEKCRTLRELAGKTVCIVGTGSVGSAVAQRFAAFEARVLGVDLFSVSNPFFESVAPASELDEILAESDVVVLSLPLTDETRRLFDRRRFERMKANAIFVNVARGAIVEESALTEALQSGRLSGAVLDVFETEPLDADSPLWTMENAIVTPHNAFVSENNNRRLFEQVLNNLHSAFAS